jgi:hypothetical protein
MAVVVGITWLNWEPVPNKIEYYGLWITTPIPSYSSHILIAGKKKVKKISIKTLKQP